MSKIRTLAFVGCVLALSLAAQASSIAFHWDYTSTTYPVTGTTGVVPNSYWTNGHTAWTTTIGSGSIASGLHDSDNQSTTAGITWNAGLDWWNGYFPTPVAGTNTVIESPGGSMPQQQTVSGIPYISYVLIVYANGGENNGAAIGHCAVSLGSGPTYYYTNTGNPIVGTAGAVHNTNDFAQATNTNSTLFPFANYAMFTGLSGSTQVITANLPTNAGITGFEIVEVPSPTALAALPILGVLYFLRRRQQA